MATPVNSMRRRPRAEFSTKRRDAMTALLALGVSSPLVVRAQPAPARRRVILFTGSPQARDWFLDGMRDHGWQDGSNIEFSIRVTQEIDEVALRSELQDRSRRVDAIVAAGGLRI